MRRSSIALCSLLFACAPAAAPTTAPVATACPEPTRVDADPLDVVKQYLDASAQGDLDRAAALVTDTTTVFESGGDEGTWGHYRDHHLGPELAQFAAFDIRPAQARTTKSVDGTLAVVMLPLEYDITLKDGRKIESVGTVTFSLQHNDDAYRIDHIHWSSRPRRKPAPKAPPTADGNSGHGHGAGHKH